MEPVKGGTLAKVPESVETLFRSADPAMSVPSWAVRFAATLPNVMVVLSGMSSLEQMEDNTGFMQDFRPLTEQEVALTHQAADLIPSPAPAAPTAPRAARSTSRFRSISRSITRTCARI